MVRGTEEAFVFHKAHLTVRILPIGGAKAIFFPTIAYLCGNTKTKLPWPQWTKGLFLMQLRAYVGLLSLGV